MSLQYIIDGYNLINNPHFRPAVKLPANVCHCLADFIKLNKLTGSKNNTLTLIFDGYPPAGQDIPQEAGLVCLFSRMIEADELIKQVVEKSACPRNIVVVSDDKEVQLMSRFLHARSCGVEEFICGKKNKKLNPAIGSDAADFKLTYSAMQKINAELKKKWLE
ncbi:MAG: NYN domain-containing protein [Candidatus Omnitrophica bacterium]|nr:NYN domain-containing protein [Candidatus Omnitrophota bacterium]